MQVDDRMSAQCGGDDIVSWKDWRVLIHICCRGVIKNTDKGVHERLRSRKIHEAVKIRRIVIEPGVENCNGDGGAAEFSRGPRRWGVHESHVPLPDVAACGGRVCLTADFGRNL